MYTILFLIALLLVPMFIEPFGQHHERTEPPHIHQEEPAMRTPMDRIIATSSIRSTNPASFQTTVRL